MILVRVDDLPASGRSLTADLSLDALNERLNEGSGNDIVFVETVHVSARVIPLRGSAKIEGRIHAHYTQPCARCLELISTDLELPLSYSLMPQAEMNPKNFADDIGIYYYQDLAFDLEDLCQEAIILSLSPFGSAHEECDPSALEFSLFHSDEEPQEATVTVGGSGKLRLGDLLEEAKKKKS